jgi:hypothetical protein
VLGHTDPQETKDDLASRARRAAWRGRLLGVLALAHVGVGVGGAAYVSAQWSAAVSDTCETWDPVDISIDELIALKRRKNAWQASMDDHAALPMSDREVNFILHKSMSFELLAEFSGDTIHARVAAPLTNGCLNVQFDGRAWVDDRVAYFAPDRLIVGELDLSGVFAGRQIAITTDLVDGQVDAGVLNALDNAEKIVVKDSTVHIQLYDRRKVW